MSLVFLSHASADREFVNALAVGFKSSGVSVWIDEAELKVGDPIKESLRNALELCDYFCIVLSKASLSSECVMWELDFIMPRYRSGQAKILPALLEHVKLPSQLAELKYANFARGYDTGFEELMRAVDMSDFLMLTPGEVWRRYGSVSVVDDILSKKPN